MEARQELRAASVRPAVVLAFVVALVAALVLAGFGGYLLREPQPAAVSHPSVTQTELPPSDPACERLGGPAC